MYNMMEVELFGYLQCRADQVRRSSTKLPSRLIPCHNTLTAVATMAPRKTYIIGVGKTKYEKPRNRIGYEELGLQAATKALLDAGIK